MKQFKKLKTRNKILLITAIFMVAFVITMIILFCKFQSTPDTLIVSVLGGSGLVEVVTGGMSIVEICKGEK